MSEQERIAKELDQRVAERTRELAEANEALKQELVVERQRTEAARRASDHDARLIAGQHSWPGRNPDTDGWRRLRQRPTRRILRPDTRGIAAMGDQRYGSS